jgi:hypothetical protein
MVVVQVPSWAGSLAFNFKTRGVRQWERRGGESQLMLTAG